jgi:nucleoside-diphosphate-sugar epimerase
MQEVSFSQSHISIPTRAKKELGYYPSVYFWDGLKQTLDWWGL